MAIEFRFLNAEDTPTYWNIRLEALQCEPEAFGSSVEEHCALLLAEITARLSGDPSNNFVVGAFLGERLVGTAGFFRNIRSQGTAQGTHLGRLSDPRGARETSRAGYVADTAGAR
jgi:hypothetical protein